MINKYIVTERVKHGLEHFPGPLFCAISHMSRVVASVKEVHPMECIQLTSADTLRFPLPHRRPSQMN